MFIIRYEKTGKEIRRTNKALFLHLSSQDLDELGFLAIDLWDEE